MSTGGQRSEWNECQGEARSPIPKSMTRSNRRKGSFSTKRKASESVLVVAGKLGLYKPIDILDTIQSNEMNAKVKHSLQKHDRKYARSSYEQNEKDKNTEDRSRRRSSIRDRTRMESHDGVNFLKLRKTDASRQALLRNRMISKEIIDQKSMPSNIKVFKPKKGVELPNKEIYDRDKQTEKRIFELGVECKRKEKKLENSFSRIQNHALRQYNQSKYCEGGSVSQDEQEKLQLELSVDATGDQLRRDGALIRRQEHREFCQLQSTLGSIRETIGSMYIFTPTYRIYRKHKLLSGLELWRKFVVFHREYCRDLKLLECYAVKIQRIFRSRRVRYIGRKSRKLRFRQEHHAVTFLQKWFRAILCRIERCIEDETNGAILMQSAWRGKKGRAMVKSMLKYKLRGLLKYLSPTGSLHRLSTFFLLGGKVNRDINWMLLILEEVHVQIEATNTYTCQRAQRAGVMPLETVISTRKELHKAIRLATQIIKKYEKIIAEGKRTYRLLVEQRRVNTESRDIMIWNDSLRAVTDRIVGEREAVAMQREERDTREISRLLKRREADERYREKRQEEIAERQSRSDMEREEIFNRYFYMHLAIREKQRKLVQFEMEKVREFKHCALEQMLCVSGDRKNVLDSKLVELEEKRSAEKELRLKMWGERTKDEAYRMMERKALMEERKLREAAERERQEEERYKREKWSEYQLNKKRLARQKDLKSQFEERLKMDFEDRAERKRMLLQKKDETSAVNWREHRLRQQLSERELDPLVFKARQMELEALQRVRFECKCMAVEDVLSTAVEKEQAREELIRRGRERRVFVEYHENIRARNELKGMRLEEERDREVYSSERNKREHERTLEEMKIVVQRDKERERIRLLEAFERKTMKDEEMKQRRVQNYHRQVERRREQSELKRMREEENRQLWVAKQIFLMEERSKQRKNRKDMLQEELYNNQNWNIREQLGLWIEQELLFETAKTNKNHTSRVHNHLVKQFFRTSPALHLVFLRENVRVLYSFLQTRYSSEEQFVEEIHLHFKEKHAADLADSKQTVRDELNRTHAASLVHVKSKWKKARGIVRFYLLGEKELIAGEKAFKENKIETAWSLFHAAREKKKNKKKNGNTNESSPPPPITLTHYLYQTHYELFCETYDRSHLMACFEHSKVLTTHMKFTCSPEFLFDVGKVLEWGGKLKKCAEIYGRIIHCFPTFEHVSQVIFRFSMVLYSTELQLYGNSREYLYHVMEKPPFAWKSIELLFLVGRLYELEANALEAKTKTGRAAASKSKISTKSRTSTMDKQHKGGKKRVSKSSKVPFHHDTTISSIRSHSNAAYEDSFRQLKFKSNVSFGADGTFASSALFEQSTKEIGSWRTWVGDKSTWFLFGNICFDHKEFRAAKDMYQLGLKKLKKHRDLKRKPSMNKLKYNKNGKAVDESDNGSESENENENTNFLQESDVWLKLGICHSVLNDRRSASHCLSKWVSLVPYLERMEEKLLLMDIRGWEKLGCKELPDKVKSAFDLEGSQNHSDSASDSDKDSDERAFEKHILKAEEKVLKEPQTYLHVPTAPKISPSDEYWTEVVDPDTGEIYFWNEKSNKTCWSRPT